MSGEFRVLIERQGLGGQGNYDRGKKSGGRDGNR